MIKHILVCKSSLWNAENNALFSYDALTDFKVKQNPCGVYPWRCPCIFCWIFDDTLHCSNPLKDVHADILHTEGSWNWQTVCLPWWQTHYTMQILFLFLNQHQCNVFCQFYNNYIKFIKKNGEQKSEREFYLPDKLSYQNVNNKNNPKLIQLIENVLIFLIKCQ